MTKKIAIVFGVIFLLIGILGFIPNQIIGDQSLFHANSLQSAVSLIIGFALLFIALKSNQKVGLAMKLLGIGYLFIAVLGFLAIGPTTDHANLFGIIGVNTASNWLHLILGLLILSGGLAGNRNHFPQSEIYQPMA